MLNCSNPLNYTAPLVLNPKLKSLFTPLPILNPMLLLMVSSTPFLAIIKLKVSFNDFVLL